VSARAAVGQLSPRASNLILKQIGRWDEAELVESHRKLSMPRPHDMHQTFALQLVTVTGVHACELERRLGHLSRRYIQRYTNPPEAVAARCV
jgi:hypothetical protein